MDNCRNMLIVVVLFLFSSLKAQIITLENSEIRGSIEVSLNGAVEIRIRNISPKSLCILSPEFWLVISDRKESRGQSKLGLGVYSDMDILLHTEFEHFPLIELPSNAVLVASLGAPLLLRRYDSETQLWSIRVAFEYCNLFEASCQKDLNYNAFLEIRSSEIIDYSSIGVAQFREKVKVDSASNYSIDFKHGAKFVVLPE